MSSVIFIDLESSGTDPNQHEILELAMIAVEYVSLREIAAVTTCINVSSGFCGNMDPYVFQMHTNSGLLAELNGPRSKMRFEARRVP